MPFKIVRNDITKMEVDAVVNTANEAPIYSTGVDTAIYRAAGEEELLKIRKEIGYKEEGDVFITPGLKLPAKYIIHAVSPLYIDGTCGEEEKLRSCYRESLKLAHEYQCKSIAFPLISTGGFGYPKEEGMRIAVDEINGFLLDSQMLIYLVVFDTKATQLGFNLYPDLEAYIDHNYVCDRREEEYGDRYFGSVYPEDPSYSAYKESCNRLEEKIRRQKESVQKLELQVPKSESFDDYEDEEESFIGAGEWDGVDFFEENKSALHRRMEHMSDTFQEYLLYLIHERNLTYTEVYKKALITKQVFSKIKNNPNYQPEKSTAMRLCIGAKLNLDETKDLLARAGYALSPCDKRDIIFSFFIENKVYDMIEIDIVLEEHGLPCFIT